MSKIRKSLEWKGKLSPNLKGNSLRVEVRSFMWTILPINSWMITSMQRLISTLRSLSPKRVLTID
jgi:hypothetical protein